MDLTKSLPARLRPGGRHGLAGTEVRDPIGYAVAALGKLAQSDLLDRVGLRKQAEQAVYTATRTGFQAATRANRAFTSAGSRQQPGVRVPATAPKGVFDLTPGEDEQMLVDVVTEFADEVVRPAATEADETCAAPEPVLKASLEIGLPILGVPEALGGISEERSAVAGTLVAEALARGDMGLAVATLAPGAVATALGLWGTEAQQQTYLPAFTGDEVPAAALALSEPTVLFDALAPSTTARRTADGFVLDGLKSAVVRAAEAELFVVGAELDGTPVLFLVESSTPGLSVESDPGMGVRAASMARLRLEGVTLPADAVLGRHRRLDVRRVRAALAPGLVCARRRHRPGRARLRHALRQGARGVRRAGRPPTVGGVHGRRHRDRAAGDAPAHLQGSRTRRRWQGLRP